MGARVVADADSNLVKADPGSAGGGGVVHEVAQGECLSSIAHNYGAFWQSLWNHPANSQLKQQRKDPNVLYAGDEVFIPTKQERQESGATERRHRFRKKGTPAKVRIRILDDEQKPMANVPYKLEIDGMLVSGNLDSNGIFEKTIPPDAKRGRLIVGMPPEAITYELKLGHLDPVESLAGIQERLADLGYLSGPPVEEMNDELRAALKAFQAKEGLPEDGEPNQQTRDKLSQVYGR
jgi:N-acetylmuramoyl-L-alanine amidase